MNGAKDRRDIDHSCLPMKVLVVHPVQGYFVASDTCVAGVSE